jgi:hypothetical protein
LEDVLDRILDNSITLEPYQRIRVKGIDLLTWKKRPVVTSIQTYLRYEKVARTRHFPATSFSSPPASHHSPANFFDLIDRILDCGIVVDASQWVRFLGMKAPHFRVRVVSVSIQTYLQPASRASRRSSAA